MPRKPALYPSLRRHKPSKQGVVTLNGKDHYCGAWPEGQDDPPAEVQARYDRTVAEWVANGRRPLTTEAPAASTAHSPPGDADDGVSLAELILAFFRHAEQHYQREDGTNTSEVSEYRRTLALLREMYGEEPVESFGPKKLKAVREAMLRKEWCRGVINQRIGRIVRMFKWGVAEEMAPVEVYRALKAVPGLQKGRTAARETEPVVPVDVAVVERTLPYCTSSVAGAVRFIRYAGCRPGESLRLRLADLDRSTPVWLYRPHQHKTAWRGKRRAIAIGPKAQEVVREYIRIRCPLCGVEGRPPRIGSPDGCICGPCADRMQEAGVCGPWQRIETQPADAYLFSPALAMAERSEDLRQPQEQGPPLAEKPPAEEGEEATRATVRRRILQARPRPRRRQGQHRPGMQGLQRKEAGRTLRRLQGRRNSRLAPQSATAQSRDRGEEALRPGGRPSGAGPCIGRRHPGVRGTRPDPGCQGGKRDGVAKQPEARVTRARIERAGSSPKLHFP